VTDPDPVAVTWGLFVLIEKAEVLPDPEVDVFVEAAESEIGTDGLLSGWALVAALCATTCSGTPTSSAAIADPPPGSGESSSTTPSDLRRTVTDAALRSTSVMNRPESLGK